MGLAWSPLALLALILMVFASLALLVALIVMGALGRFRRRPPAEEDFLPPAGLPISGVTFTLPGPAGPPEGAEASEPAVPSAEAADEENGTNSAAPGPAGTEGGEEGTGPAGGDGAPPAETNPARQGRLSLAAARLFARKAAAEEEAPARQTGLAWLVAGLLLPLPATLAFSLIDYPQGPMRMLTPGAVACFLLLGAQAACCVFLIRTQRRL